MKKLLTAMAAVLSVSVPLAEAADREQVREIKPLRTLIAQKLDTAKLDSALGLKAGIDSLKARKTYTDKLGVTTVRYQQMFRGLPVLNEDIVVSTHADGAFKLGYGSVLKGIARDVKSIRPALTERKVLKNAKALAAATASGRLSYENETTQLAIWQDAAGKARLVYEVSFVQYGDKPSRPHFIIDARSGDVLKSFDNLQTADAHGPGGNQKTGIYYYGTDFDYMDVTQSGSTCVMDNDVVKTINLRNRKYFLPSSAYAFTCPENTYKSINGAYSPLNDAHYFGKVIFDMYSDWLNTAPLTFQLQMRVHYGRNYQNAFWNGTSMTFGDGAGTFYPLVSLDVSAHEVSHGFTEQNSGLVYSGKSGGLNEAFSDMAGEAAEFYMTGTNDWMVGEQIFKGTGALRYMDDPTLDGISIGHQSDYYNGMDVHYSSGVYNKAFYLLATTAGWDTQEAFEVYARANMLYWTANTDWDTAGDGVMDAACDLGYSVSDVQASLSAVGISSDVSPGSSCN